MTPGSPLYLMSVVAMTCAVALAVAGCDTAQPGIYTMANAPDTPALADLPLTDTVVQHGITWTFDKNVPVGQFVNGDWYVVGPVTVTAIAPAPLFGKDVPADTIDETERKEFGGGNPRLSEKERDALKAKPRYCRNGSVLNIPPVMNASGFDSRLRHGIYDPDLTARLPIAMKPGDALVSTISKGKIRRSKHYSTTQVVAVLTCLGAPAPADAFRPGYCDPTKQVYLARNLRRDRLPKLAKVADMPKVEDLAKRFERPWLATTTFHEDHAPYQIGGYCQGLALKGGQAALLLCLDMPAAEKEPLLQAFVQMGLDYWGIVRSGHPGWQAWGGWNSGHKLPIVFAGYILGEDEMANVSKTYPKTSFQEDEQTAYGKSWTGAPVVFTGHSAIEASTGKGRIRGGKDWGPYEHKHPKDWHDRNHQSEAYRRCCTSRAWVGEALAVRILGLEKAWGHDAFLDYVDRWVTDVATDAKAVVTVAEAAKAKGEAYKGYAGVVGEWGRQGAIQDEFAAAMWKAYRATLKPGPEAWRDKAPVEPPKGLPSAKAQ
ncbi:MAG TPA: hypothetical protein VNA25_20480 [Phycisphaerae bacterium]|nr:hypothetical protein [Phycisphaerae bacterium]